MFTSGLSSAGSWGDVVAAADSISRCLRRESNTVAIGFRSQFIQLLDDGVFGAACFLGMISKFWLSDMAPSITLE